MIAVKMLNHNRRSSIWVGIRAVTALVAALSISAKAAEPSDWAPVLLQHQDFDGEVGGYPVPFGDDGMGEMTLYQWSERSSDSSVSWFGYFWQYRSERALAVALEITNDQLSAALFMGPQQCERVAGEAFTLADDPAGQHPIMAIQNLTLSSGFGVIYEKVPVENGRVDWTDLPQDGRRFYRTWNAPPHLYNSPPDIDGVVLRYEPQGGYTQALSGGGTSGRGNTPHHWNLLAYTLKPLGPERTKLKDHPAAPLDWPCAEAFNDLRSAFGGDLP